MSETAPFTMPGASASPPTSVDAALVAQAAALAAPAPAVTVVAVPVPAEPLPISAPALASLVAQVTQHVHAAPAARAASVLASMKSALDAAVAVHTNAVIANATAAKSQSAASVMLGDVTKTLTAIETTTMADVKGATGLLVPKWAIGVAALLVGAGVGALMMHFFL